MREVQEEAGVGVASIHVVGSQPWPVRRANSPGSQVQRQGLPWGLHYVLSAESQAPWCPQAGRGGTCELMVGAVAKATSLDLDVDTDEMDDVSP